MNADTATTDPMIMATKFSDALLAMIKDPNEATLNAAQVAEAEALEAGVHADLISAISYGAAAIHLNVKIA